MSGQQIEFLPSGDTALTVQFGYEIDKTLNSRIMAMSQKLSDANIAGVLEIVPTYRSMLVHYDPLLLTQADLIKHLEPLIDTSVENTSNKASHWQIPVCFTPEFAPDLNHVAKAANMKQADVIAAVLGTTHHVYMLGFAPGQPYMGDLPPQLKIPRRENPVPRIEKGSLVTATGLTIIYPVANPTGWHVIGRTPVDIFDLSRPEPVLLSPGDKVTLTEIDSAEFARIQDEVTTGNFDITALART